MDSAPTSSNKYQRCPTFPLVLAEQPQTALELVVFRVNPQPLTSSSSTPPACLPQWPSFPATTRLHLTPLPIASYSTSLTAQSDFLIAQTRYSELASPRRISAVSFTMLVADLLACLRREPLINCGFARREFTSVVRKGRLGVSMGIRETACVVDCNVGIAEPPGTAGNSGKWDCNCACCFLLFSPFSFARFLSSSLSVPFCPIYIYFYDRCDTTKRQRLHSPTERPNDRTHLLCSLPLSRFCHANPSWFDGAFSDAAQEIMEASPWADSMCPSSRASRTASGSRLRHLRSPKLVEDPIDSWISMRFLPANVRILT